LKNKSFSAESTKGNRTSLVFGEHEKPPNGKLTHILERPGREAVSFARSQVQKHESENTGTQAVGFSDRTARSAARMVRSGDSRLKFEPQPGLSKADKKAMYKRRLKKNYAKSFRSQNTQRTGKSAKKAKKGAEKSSNTIQRAVKSLKKKVKRKILIFAGSALLFLMVLMSGFSSCMIMFGGGFNTIISTSYTAEDEDILGADEDYITLQNALAARIANISNEYPGYHEYRYSLDSIGHDPFELASYLTVKYSNYTRAAVQGELSALLALQYRLTLTPVTEIRRRTEIRIGYYYDEYGILRSYTYFVEVEYEYHILNVSLVNRGIEAVALSLFTPEQIEMYHVYMETRGNKPHLFP